MAITAKDGRVRANRTYSDGYVTMASLNARRTGTTNPRYNLQAYTGAGNGFTLQRYAANGSPTTIRSGTASPPTNVGMQIVGSTITTYTDGTRTNTDTTIGVAGSWEVPYGTQTELVSLDASFAYTPFKSGVVNSQRVVGRA